MISYAKRYSVLFVSHEWLIISDIWVTPSYFAFFWKAYAALKLCVTYSNCRLNTMSEEKNNSYFCYYSVF